MVRFIILFLFMVQLTMVVSLKNSMMSRTTRSRSSWRRSLSMATDTLILQGIPALLERNSRPGHVGIPRARMDLPFAVLLMRKSYEVADELDYTPMDEFQKDFFTFRQNEWEEYKQHHENMLQGDLSDPYYFDFISFCQSVVLAYTMRNGLQDFVEKVGAEGETLVVRRDEKYKENKLLPTVHAQLTGDRILQTMFEKYPASILPPATAAAMVNPITREQLIQYFQLLLDVFTINSYCLSAIVSDVTPTANIANGILVAKIDLRAPANLWSEMALRGRKESIVNDFDVKVLEAYGRRFGLTTTLVNWSVTQQIEVVHCLKVSGLSVPKISLE